MLASLLPPNNHGHERHTWIIKVVDGGLDRLAAFCRGGHFDYPRVLLENSKVMIMAGPLAQPKMSSLSLHVCPGPHSRVMSPETPIWGLACCPCSSYPVQDDPIRIACGLHSQSLFSIQNATAATVATAVELSITTVLLFAG